MAVLMYVDNDKRMSKAEVRIEQKIKKLDALEKRLKKEQDNE